jgi:ribonucleotide monophosphatase NagD (HAD superfamily)
VAELSSKLGVTIDTSMFVQSHTPFAAMEEYKHNKTVLVVGGEKDNCRKVAEAYVRDRIHTLLAPAADIDLKHRQIRISNCCHAR